MFQNIGGLKLPKKHEKW